MAFGSPSCVNKDTRPSFVSTLGLTAAVLLQLYAPGFYDASPWFALSSPIMGTGIGLLNGPLA